MNSFKKKRTLADNISFLLSKENTSVDPEEDIYEETKAKVVDDDQLEEDVTFSTSSLRKFNTDLLESVDQKYRGGVTSRKSFQYDSDEIYSSDEDQEAVSSSSNMPDLKRSISKRKRKRSNSLDDDYEAEDSDHVTEEENSPNNGSDDYEEDEGDTDTDEDSTDVGGSFEDGGNEGSFDEDDLDDSRRDHEVDSSSFLHMSKKDANQEIKKGSAVRNQLAMWDNLLECRIQFQKILAISNKLPQHNVYAKFRSKGGAEFASSTSKTANRLSNCLDSLLELQKKLLDAYPETKDLSNPASKVGDSSDDISSSDEEQAEKPILSEESESKVQLSAKKKQTKVSYSEILEKIHLDFASFRNATIEKWNSKTQVALGTSSRNFNAFEQSTLKQIERILADRNRVIRRTQLKRSEYRVLGSLQPIDIQTNDNQINNGADSSQEENCSAAGTNQEYCAEIFDDSDFYHQLLRELIERRSADVTDPVQLGRQWIQLQKMRNRMKRKIDVKATKGRRLRYGVHSKLVNYMAPQPFCSMNGEAITELYSSLFGKRKV